MVMFGRAPKRGMGERDRGRRVPASALGTEGDACLRARWACGRGRGGMAAVDLHTMSFPTKIPRGRPRNSPYVQ